MTTTATKRDRPYYPGGRGRCGGDGCVAEDTWPLHNVRHRSVFCRLCTSCVLKYHPGSFCTSCFELFEGPQPSGAVRHCSGCSSLSHTSCLPTLDREGKYLCPVCANSGGSFSYFPVGSKKAKLVEGEEQRDCLEKAIDRESAKVLLAAAQIASSSMNRAVTMYRVEAERKVKEAVVAKKRAREMLERAIFVAKEREMTNRFPGRGLDPPAPQTVASRKKPALKPGSGAPAAAASAALAAQKRIQSREREKLMKFHDAIPLAQVLPDQAVERRGSYVGGSPNCTPGPRNHGIENKEKNGIFVAHQSKNVSNQEKGKVKEVAYPNCASQMPSSN